jgi:hypothetical protein
LVASSASSTLIGGRIEGRRRAIIVLPEPGGPSSSTLCPPAAATLQRALHGGVALHVGEIVLHPCLARLQHRDIVGQRRQRLRQPHHGHHRQPVADIDLYVNRAGVDHQCDAGLHVCEHERYAH